MDVLVAFLLGSGIYLMGTSWLPGVYRPAAKALRCRADRKMTSTQVLVERLADRLEPLLDLDPIRRAELADILTNLRYPESPERFRAKAAAQAAVMTCAVIWLPFFSVPIGVAAVVATAAAVYQREEKKLKLALEQRRKAIERELPQFASTIRQSLNTTRDVTTILRNYKRSAGPALRQEIERTLNEAVTGNIEKAVSRLEARVASARLGQLTRGLIAVLRGDDQRAYFDVLAGEYRKAQDEEVNRLLLERPKALHPYMAAMFAALVVMIAATVGVDLIEQMGNMF